MIHSPLRRSFFKKVAAVSALATVGCKASVSSPLISSESAKTYVLVHGAWHGGWCWRDVREKLEHAGHHVFTPTMTGLGERKHLNSREVNLATHVQDIVNVFEFEDLSNVILVGHSYAGYVVSLVADVLENKIASLVYLDAVLPIEGKAFFTKEQQAIFEAQYVDYNMPVGSLKFLGIPDDHEKASWVKSHLTPHPLGTFFETVNYTNGGATGLPKTFIRCMKTQTFKNGDPVKDMTEKENSWTYKLIDTGHDAMVTSPEQLSEMLLNI